MQGVFLHNYKKKHFFRKKYFKIHVIAILIGVRDVDEAEVAEARRKGDLDDKLRAMLREIAWQVVLLVLFTWVVIGSLDSNVFYQNGDIRNAFIEDADVRKMRN